MAGDDNSAMNPSPRPYPTPSLHATTRLTDWGVIRAAGAEARSFLHGQLSNDMLDFDSGRAKLAGYCSAKGRLLASFVVWSDSADEVLLACSADVLPAALKRLSMYVLRAKCQLSDASAEVPLSGMTGSAVPSPAAAWRRSVTPDGTRLIHLPEAAVQGQRIARALSLDPTTAPDTLSLDSWRWLEVQSGTPRIVAATVEQFVPQMVNLELVGGVNFQKGCYPGQEIVARSQYRGSIKRRAFVVTSEAALQPGQEVFQLDEPTQPAGMVVLAGSCGDQHAALVELKLAAASSASELRAGDAQGPRLMLAALPYDMPAEAA
jgi:tRNA-modifying protein YgfZ